MRNYDSTAFWRSSIGFDRLFDLINNAELAPETDSYPPYDIVRTGEDAFRLTLALAGFAPDDITITAQQDLLTVAGRKSDTVEHEFIYHGIAARPFERRFSLADHVQVRNASFDDGLLRIELVREVPEAMKPRHIEIGTVPTRATTKGKNGLSAKAA